MKNLTVSIDDDVYRSARIWAAEHGHSLSAAVNYFLSALKTDFRARYFLNARGRNPTVKRPVAPAQAHLPNLPLTTATQETQSETVKP